MSQLLVRNIEQSVVKKLRRRAADLGVSVEEAHRRLLRGALSGEATASNLSFTKYLCSIPKGDDDIELFPRSRDLPREISL